jgi:hypothetical protein
MLRNIFSYIFIPPLKSHRPTHVMKGERKGFGVGIHLLQYITSNNGTRISELDPDKRNVLRVCNKRADTH